LLTKQGKTQFMNQHHSTLTTCMLMYNEFLARPDLESYEPIRKFKCWLEINRNNVEHHYRRLIGTYICYEVFQDIWNITTLDISKEYKMDTIHKLKENIVIKANDLLKSIKYNNFDDDTFLEKWEVENEINTYEFSIFIDVEKNDKMFIMGHENKINSIFHDMVIEFIEFIETNVVNFFVINNFHIEYANIKSDYVNLLKKIKNISSDQRMLKYDMHVLSDNEINLFGLFYYLHIDDGFQEEFNKILRSGLTYKIDKQNEVNNKTITRQAIELTELKEKTKDKKKSDPLPEYSSKLNSNSWDNVIIVHLLSTGQFNYKTLKGIKPFYLSKDRKALLNQILALEDIPLDRDFKHDKTMFSRLNKNLRELFNKTINPLEWNGNQKVYKVKFIYNEYENSRNYKEIPLTEKNEAKLQSNQYNED